MLDYNIILASASPRRKELLSIYFNNFKIMPAHISEQIPDNISNENAPLYIAKQKADAVKKNINENELIISADTVVLLNNTVFGKPKIREDAFNMLSSLSNKEHKVITGVCCYNKSKSINIEFSDTTLVQFNKLTNEMINNYLDTNEYIDKAGAYAIQGKACMFVKQIIGSYDNVVGLPMGKLALKLLENNIKIL